MREQAIFGSDFLKKIGFAERSGANLMDALADILPNGIILNAILLLRRDVRFWYFCIYVILRYPSPWDIGVCFQSYTNLCSHILLFPPVGGV
jgi:hypothetical protein